MSLINLYIMEPLRSIIAPDMTIDSHLIST